MINAGSGHVLRKAELDTVIFKPSLAPLHSWAKLRAEAVCECLRGTVASHISGRLPLGPSSTALAGEPGSPVARPWHAKWQYWDAFVSEASCPLHSNGSLAHSLLRRGTAPLGDVSPTPGDPAKAYKGVRRDLQPGHLRGLEGVPLPTGPSLAVLRLGPGSRGPGTPTAPQRLNPEEAREGRRRGCARRSGERAGRGEQRGQERGALSERGSAGSTARTFLCVARPRRRWPAPGPRPRPRPARRSLPARWQPRPPSILRVSSGRAAGPA